MHLTGLRLVLLASFCLALIPPMAQASSGHLRQLRALSRHAEVTGLVVRLRDMHTLASLHPDRRLRPASVSKLFAAAAALEQFGPAHHFTSRLTSRGTLRHRTLHGNLVFVGGGDPSLDNRHLQELVMRLKARGVRRVTGHLVVDEGLWGHIPCLTQDRCAAEDRASHAYSAPLSSAGVDFGTVTVTVYAGARAGARSRVRLTPLDLSGYAIDNQVRTGAADSPMHVQVWRTYHGGRSTLHLRGSLPVGYGPYRCHRAVTGAASETARALSAMLDNAGIRIAGRATVRSNGTDNHRRTLASTDSASLATQLIPMMAYSNNYMADTLTLDLAVDQGDSPPLTLPRAAQSLESLSARANRFAYPAHSSGHGIFDSGSGLSLGNRISARDVVSLLAYMFHQNALFPAFYGSLPVPKFSPYNTLKHGNSDFENRIVAKTGTLTQPVSVRAIAGYLRLANGGFAAYAIMINGTSADPTLTKQQTVDAYQQDLESLLARN